MSKAFTLCCTLDEAKEVREGVAFLQGVKVILTKRTLLPRRRVMSNASTLWSDYHFCGRV